MDKKHDIFVSYSRHDTNVVNEFVERLEREGFSVWIDRDGIESGDAFKRIILQAIKNSAVVLFFSSQHSNQSGWTAKEIGVAVKYQKTVIPVLLDGSNFNEEVEFDLINLDFIDYQDASLREMMMDRLVKSLKAKIPNPMGQKKAEEARLKAEAVERARLEQERRKKEDAERKAREAAERERKAQQATAVAQPLLSDKSAPKKKKTLWIALGIGIAAVIAALLLLLKPKQEPTPTDPDTQAYEACQTVADYRAYMSDYGRNALHFADAKAFVDQYMADSIEQAFNAQALADAAQKEEAERQAQAKAEKKEDDAYRKCTTIAACDSYLRTYPQGRYLTEVRAKKAELEKQEAEQKEKAAYDKCTTITACENYLKTYPQGRYVAEVKAKKAELEKNTPKSGSYNGHEWVDLGLPSGTLWATCNIGANKPEGYGNYYVWGETQTKSSYSWATYEYTKGYSEKLKKYCNKSDYGDNGFTDNLTTLQGSDDPAAAIWGGGWHTPSKEQWDELLANTTHQWTTQNGVAGRLFTSKKNGKTLFLPASGHRRLSELINAGSVGDYWSRSLSTDYPVNAWSFGFNSDYYGMNYYDRVNGFSVRPVRER